MLMDMKQIIRYIILSLVIVTGLTACHERYITYADAEYVMFADTMKVYAIVEDAQVFSIPVVSTVAKD